MRRSIKNLRLKTFIAAFLTLVAALDFAAAQTKNSKKRASANSKTMPKAADKKSTSKTSIAAKKTNAEQKNSKTLAAKLSDRAKPAAKTAIKPNDKTKKASDKTKSNAKTPAKSVASLNAAKLSKSTAPNAAKAAAKNSNSSASAKTTAVKKPMIVKTSVKPAAVKIIQPKIDRRESPKALAAPLTRKSAQAIVVVAAARVRTAPNTDAEEMRRLKLGTLVKVTEENPAWYKVEISASSKQTGWLSKQVADDYDRASRQEIYRQIADRNYKTDKISFADAAELYEFLTRAESEVKTADFSSEIAYKRLLALRAALKAVPSGKGGTKPYADFLKANDQLVVYSEPSGEWYVRSERLWELRENYAAKPIAEEIAWTAAQNPLPGECEGYINCYLFVLRETEGKYLTLYPHGKYAAQSLKNIQSLLEPIAADAREKSVYNGPTDVSDRAEFNRLLAELRVVVSKLPSAEIEKQKTLGQLDRIAEGYR